MDVDLFIYIVILLSALAMAILPLIKDVISDRRKTTHNFFKRLTWSGKWLIVAATITIGFSIWKEVRENKFINNERDKFSGELSYLRNTVDTLLYTIDTLSNDPASKVNEGLAMSGILSINDILEERRKFIYDFGLNEVENRISLYLDYDNDLVLRVIDNKGETFSVRAPQNFLTFKKGARYFLYGDVGYSDNYSFIRLFLDDRLIAKQEFDYKICFSNNLKKFPNMHIGSDINGKYNGAFALSFWSIGLPFTRKEMNKYRSLTIDLFEGLGKDY